MAFSEQEEQDIKKRILSLEEEKNKLLAKIEGGAAKSEMKTELDLIRKDLAEARRELAEMKAGKPVVKPVTGPGPEDEEDEDGFPFDMTHKGAD